MYALFDDLVRRLAGPAEIWGEKTPGHLWWWRPISLAAPWMRFVLVVRDPRAVVASLLAMPWQEVDESALRALGGRLHMALAARWAFDQQIASALLRDLGPSRVLLLRYEDLVADPAAARSSIAGLLGPLRPSAPSVPSVSSAPSLPGRMQEAPASVVHEWEHWKKRAMGDVASDRLDSWRSELGTERAEEVAWVCRKQMPRFGYPVKPSRDALVGFKNRKLASELKEMTDRWSHYCDRIAEIEL